VFLGLRLVTLDVVTGIDGRALFFLNRLLGHVHLVLLPMGCGLRCIHLLPDGRYLRLITGDRRGVAVRRGPADHLVALQPAADRVWAAALTLILLVLVLNLLARLVARFSTIKSK